MNWGQFQDPVYYMCLAGSVNPSGQTPPQEDTHPLPLGRHPSLGRHPLDRHLPGRHPPGRYPWVDTLPGRHPRADKPPPRDGHNSGRYAYYWNAFLTSNEKVKRNQP